MNIWCKNYLDVTQCNFCPNWMVCNLRRFWNLKFSLLCLDSCVLSLLSERLKQQGLKEVGVNTRTWLWIVRFGGAKSAEAGFGLCLSCLKWTFASERFLYGSGALFAPTPIPPTQWIHRLEEVTAKEVAQGVQVIWSLEGCMLILVLKLQEERVFKGMGQVADLEEGQIRGPRI